ncbi:MAG TPA: outer membrane beta-barrel protein [Xanthobacteraceae bacterium]|jgi:opacity protein-like surface antigen
MSSVRILALAGAAAAAMSTVALAADFPPALPAQPAYQPVQASESGWYLRGDVGVGAQRFEAFDHFQTNAAFVWPASWSIVQKQTDDSAFVDFGVGYQVNNWFRFDFTGEHRASAKFKVIGSYREFCPGGATCFDQYDGSHSAEVLMLNAYVDLGTWWCLTPFVGAGVGGAWNSVTTVSDLGIVNTNAPGFGFSSSDATNWNLAWSAQAGIAYNVSSNLKLELAVRYLNLGSVKTPVVNCSSTGCQGSGGPAAYYTLTNFDSLDLKLGMRWLFQPEPPAYSPPLIRKG